MMAAGRESVVVVGGDGSPASVDALVHGFGEADARGGWVEVVTAWSWPGTSAEATELGRAHEGRRHALAIQAAAVTKARRRYRGPCRLTAVIVEGDPATVLAHAGRGAACLVIGKCIDDSPLDASDSTRERCLALATSPVVVVPERLDLDERSA